MYLKTLTSIVSCLISYLPYYKSYTYSEWCWGLSTVLSRQNNIQTEAGVELGLTPVWDMMNHSEVKCVESYIDGESYELIVEGGEEWEEGEEVCMGYGRGNDEYFHNMGFVIPNPEYSVPELVEGWYEINDELKVIRSMCLKKLGLEVEGNWVRFHMNVKNDIARINEEILILYNVMACDKTGENKSVANIKTPHTHTPSLKPLTTF